MYKRRECSRLLPIAPLTNCAESGGGFIGASRHGSAAIYSFAPSLIVFRSFATVGLARRPAANWPHSRKHGDPIEEKPPASAPRIRAGARLVREWNGRTHTVTVEEEGFTYAGRNYRSLTAIAREITGARWSGPRFFGLTSKKGASDA
jgi:hypothetical protein